MMFQWFHVDLIKSDGDNLFPADGFESQCNAGDISFLNLYWREGYAMARQKYYKFQYVA